MVIEKQVTWLDDYKKEVKTLMYELDNLDQKQLRALSLRLKSNAKNVIADSDYKIPDDYFGVAKSILLEDKNIKDEYKFTFWKSVYLYLVEKDSSDSFDNETYLSLFKSQNYKIKDKTFDDFIKRLMKIGVSNPSIYRAYYYNIYYDIDMALHLFNNLLKNLRVFFDLKINSFVVDCKSSSVEKSQHLVALFDESNLRGQDLKLTPKLPTDLNTIIFKAVIYELVFPDQADQVWDEFVGSQCFKNYLKTFSQKNINNNLTSMDDSDFFRSDRRWLYSDDERIAGF